MWAEFGAIHGVPIVPWMEAVTQRCHVLQCDGVPCTRKQWKPALLLPKHLHNSKQQCKPQTPTDMAKDAI